MITTDKMHPELKSFIEDLKVIIKDGESEEVITENVRSRIKRLLTDDGVIPAAYKIPNPDKYTLYPVYIAPDNSFCIASAVWDVGQSTPIHDHGTWGVIGIIQGNELEIHYDVDSKNELIAVQEREFQKGDTVVCCKSDRDLHKVQCVSSIPCVGIHVYGGNIGEMERHMYDPVTGNKRTVVTAWDTVTAVE
ncbi:hypothetical protein ACFPRA_07295 [Sporosarcina soli]|uniref:Cysteine dioxygenase n=1 Tax=Sporosarcina soli TaxID=334736 RepID=A0ABW0TGU5_9BACL